MYSANIFKRTVCLHTNTNTQAYSSHRYPTLSALVKKSYKSETVITPRVYLF